MWTMQQILFSPPSSQFSYEITLWLSAMFYAQVEIRCSFKNTQCWEPLPMPNMRSAIYASWLSHQDGTWVEQFSCEHSGMLFALIGNLEQHTKTHNKFPSPQSRLRGEFHNVNQSVIKNANQLTLSHIASSTDKPSISGLLTTPTPQSIDLNTNEVHTFEIKIDDDWNWNFDIIN